jgi:hypothetical protein
MPPFASASLKLDIAILIAAVLIKEILVQNASLARRR